MNKRNLLTCIVAFIAAVAFISMPGCNSVNHVSVKKYMYYDAKDSTFTYTVTIDSANGNTMTWENISKHEADSLLIGK
jgi:hypothetical protein